MLQNINKYLNNCKVKGTNGNKLKRISPKLQKDYKTLDDEEEEVEKLNKCTNSNGVMGLKI